MTPPRFQSEVLNDEDVHLRRVPENQPSDTQKPNKNQGASLMGSQKHPTPHTLQAQAQTPSQGVATPMNIQEVAVLDILKQK